MKKRLSILMLMMLTAIPLMAEEMAAGWTALQVQKKWDVGVNWYMRGEYRAKDNFSATDCYFFRTGVGYTFCPYVSTQITYDFITNPEPKKQQHRMLLDLTGKYSKDGWTVSLRERYVMGYSMQSGQLGHVLRSMPNVSYHIGDTRWTPNIAAELYNDLTAGNKFALKTYHIFAGMKCAIDPVNSLQLSYVFQGWPNAEKHLHTLALYYFISLP